MLLLGKQFTKKNASKVGGVITLFEQFKKELDKKNLSYNVIDLNWRNYHNPLFAYILIITNIIIKVPQNTHISFHGTANEHSYIAPLVVLLSKIFSKKIMLRKFAGNFHEVHKTSNLFKKYLIEYALKNANIVFFETKYLVEYFKQFNRNIYWFPNVREKQLTKETSSFAYKFVFIGQIKEEKGINEILKAFTKLDESYQCHLYGPIDNKYTEEQLNTSNVLYKKLLLPEEVIPTLKEYNVLVLPTFWKGEGYPGVILEALSIGLPVIATNLQGIKEIVTHNKNGLLINPKSVEELITAIKTFSNTNYQSFSSNALKEFQLFDSQVITSNILEKFYES